MPDIPGLAGLKPWTPREATATDKVPDYLVILGGGVVGCEMATAYGSYSKKVTLLSSSSALLPKFEPEAGKRVEMALEDCGVDVHLFNRADSFQSKSDGTFEAFLSTGTIITGTKVLVATGQRSRTRDVGLETLEINQLSLKVDDSLCVALTQGRWLYAIGDANSRSTLTHMGAYQARAAALTIIAHGRDKLEPKIEPLSNYSASADLDAISEVVMTDPSVASVGLTIIKAKKRGLKVRGVAVPFQFPGAWVHAELNYDGWAQ
jgi:pyruvate/2-oxoglutarate dehydrogenase complex dihydrolipoamide dehydrogenase (E3) component